MLTTSKFTAFDVFVFIFYMSSTFLKLQELSLFMYYRFVDSWVVIIQTFDFVSFGYVAHYPITIIKNLIQMQGILFKFKYCTPIINIKSQIVYYTDFYCKFIFSNTWISYVNSNIWSKWTDFFRKFKYGTSNINIKYCVKYWNRNFVHTKPRSRTLFELKLSSCRLTWN